LAPACKGPHVLGVGIDVEERTALSRLDAQVLGRAAERWLGPRERAWCATQRSLAESMTVVLCCKEAAYKACRTTSAPHELRLALRGTTWAGRATGQGGAPATIEVAWQVSHPTVLALAVAARNGSVAEVLDRLFSCWMFGYSHGRGAIEAQPYRDPRSIY
jgi:phosphopantetheinyl transferase (holo-ACP synthase)